MREDYPQIIINYYLASSKNININNWYWSFLLFSELLVSLFTGLLTITTCFLMSIPQFLLVAFRKPLIGQQVASDPLIGCPRHSLLCWCLILIFSWPRINKQTQSTERVSQDSDKVGSRINRVWHQKRVSHFFVLFTGRCRQKHTC